MLILAKHTWHGHHHFCAYFLVQDLAAKYEQTTPHLRYQLRLKPVRQIWIKQGLRSFCPHVCPSVGSGARGQLISFHLAGNIRPPFTGHCCHGTVKTLALHSFGPHTQTDHFDFVVRLVRLNQLQPITIILWVATGDQFQNGVGFMWSGVGAQYLWGPLVCVCVWVGRDRHEMNQETDHRQSFLHEKNKSLTCFYGLRLIRFPRLCDIVSQGVVGIRCA